MDETLIKNWNEVIPKDAHVFHLGDVSFHKPEKTIEILNRLNGKIYLMRGNHEKPALDSKCISRFEWVKDIYDLTIELEEGKKQIVVLCHYPMLTWNRAYHLSWMLYGHCHNNISEETNKSVYRIDVGVDACEYKPISFNEVMEKMKAKNIPNKSEKV